MSSRELPRIVSAENDLLIDATGHRLIDMFSANGAALLGHAHPRIAAAIKTQLDAVWLTGGLPTPAFDRARDAVELLFPATHGLAGIYSTGMEAAEFAMRLARIHTGRSDFVGFSASMHGKSSATAALSWDNAPPLAHIHRLPSLAQTSEREILDRLDHCLGQHRVAAVFLEPVLGTGGGHVASSDFCTSVIALCRARGSLVVMDEILTGFFRTGPLFVHKALPELPDVVLLGKAIANGFPAAAVITRRDVPCTPSMLPGSTFAGNPIAAAAITATLHEFSMMEVPSLIDAISRAVQTSLGGITGATLRGAGALWMIELPSFQNARRLAETLYGRGIFASYTGSYLRLLPSATITTEHLSQACRIVRDLLVEKHHG